MSERDLGLLAPVTVGFDDPVADEAVLGALVAAEVALTRAWCTVGVAPAAAADAVSAAFGWRGAGEPCAGHGIDPAALAAAGASVGNPVIPLVGTMRERVAVEHRPWIHPAATSQDVLDSALMLVARRSAEAIDAHLVDVEATLVAIAAAHRDSVAAARTLGQHAVPTTVGLRAATWLAGVRRARRRLADAAGALPAQLGGAAGTLAASVETATRTRGPRDALAAAEALPATFAAELALATPDAPWHTTRWPVTELGDALVQAVDAAGVVAADVATLSRTEIGELAEGAPAGSSAMPHKRNPAASVLIRSAAIRAPHLAATLHTAAALAVDERPDGAWHAEWPALRELLRLALGATGTLSRLIAGLTIDDAAIARNLGATGGLIVSERVSAVLAPVLGADAVARIIARAAGGESFEGLVREAVSASGADVDIDDLLEPARYTGLAGRIVDRSLDIGVEEPS
ncbi:lyase family protein [Microbacter sp. GSS18]|nr:lyase family protein [Microbacter sp. GSS18]